MQRHKTKAAFDSAIRLAGNLFMTAGGVEIRTNRLSPSLFMDLFSTFSI